MRCFCIGHRDTPEGLYPNVLQTVETLVKGGVTEFIVGGYGAFDRMAARAVCAIKTRYPVRLTFLTPYHSCPIPHGFDEAWCPFTSAALRRIQRVKRAVPWSKVAERERGKQPSGTTNGMP